MDACCAVRRYRATEKGAFKVPGGTRIIFRALGRTVPEEGEQHRQPLTLYEVSFVYSKASDPHDSSHTGLGLTFYFLAAHMCM